MSLEGSLQAVGSIDFTSDQDASAPIPPTAAPYDLYGGSVGLILDVLGGREVSHLRMLLGTGAYRVVAAKLPEQETPIVTAIGLHLGFETILKRWSRSAISVGIRGMVLPDVNGERLWFVPIEVGIRLW